MDTQTYAAATAVCALLAGRLSDDVLGTVREDYSVGEDESAENALLLNLAYEGVGITAEERDLIRALLGDPTNPDLDNVPHIDAVPPLPYRFGPTAPPGASDPTRADHLLSAAAPRQGARRLRRAWRQPLPGAPGGATWLYVAQVGVGVDELRAYAGLTSTLWIDLREKWQIEVVVEGKLLPPYQAAALTAAHQVWTA